MKHWLFVLVFTAIGFAPAYAHDGAGEATYIANEGVLIADGDTKIMFDPFFAQGFGIYQTVPDTIKTAIIDQSAPFDGVDAIFVSHVHGDHYDGKAVQTYMQINTDVHVFLPEQGARYQRELASGDAQTLNRIHGIELARGDAPKSAVLDNIKATAVRIPHSGWPGRADVNNIVWRVTLNDHLTVMHMGDADVDDTHYTPHDAHWQALRTQHAFPPYWFLDSREGLTILSNRMNIDGVTGTHVPIKVPFTLRLSGQDYFDEPGEIRTLPNKGKTHE